ncbi:MAG: VCBS repeat-containing protein [Lewinellaceae bacterium]|nr:VCBS repeat-containing protein [Saprospiraceae bacterium]MCB9336908.1 VCBS repeat-containing protein [Lewinellaceae bacterium]
MKNHFLPILFLLLAVAELSAQGFVKVIDANNPITNFTISPAHTYVGAAWVDFDNDGDIDLFAAPNKLFENLGGGNFQTKSHAIGAGIVPGDWLFAGTSWADVDNDGDMDCLLVYAKSKLYLNDGTGVFTAVATPPFNANNSGWAGALGDFNGDHFMDVAIANPFPAAGWDGLVFSSTGSGTWQSITGLAFTDSSAPYTVPTWADYDDDGDFDLFVAAGPAVQPPAAPDFLYKNELTETGSPALVPLTGFPFDTPQDGQSYSFIDYDNDGHLDICLANYVYAPNRLYHNNGDGTYTSVNTPFTATSLSHSLSNAWGDFDNDGNLDVIFTRDGVLTARFYKGDGAGGFMLQTSPVSQHKDATGATVGDYDNDGDLDVFLHGPTNVAGNGRALFRNDFNNSNHWVSFQLKGVESNRAAIGAKVRIKAIIGGVAKWLRRDVSAQNTFQGQNDLRVHFGLGDATMIDSLVVWWPSGQVTTCSHVPLDQFHTVTETDGTWDLCVTPVRERLDDETITISPNPAGGDIFIKMPGNTKGKVLSVEVFNSAGQRVEQGVFSEKMDVSGLQTGLFWVVVSDGVQRWRGSFVKK